MLAGLLDGVQDFTPAWPRVERVIMDMEKQQFLTEGEYGGDKWEPLNETYAAYKRSRYGSKGILVATGIGLRSLTERGAQGHYYNAGPNFVEIGTTVPYMAFHQRGNEKLPKRTVIPVPPKEVGEAIVDIFLAHIFQRMRAALGKGQG